MSNLMPNSPQSSDIRQNTESGISDFKISGQCLKKENCYNSKTVNYIDMKIGQATKLDKRKQMMSKKLDDNVMSENYDVIIIFTIYG